MKPLDEYTLISAREILAYVDRDHYMSKRAAAIYLCLSLRNFESRLDQLPHYRVGSKLLFRKSELDLWMEAHRESSGDSLSSIADEVLESLK